MITGNNLALVPMGSALQSFKQPENRVFMGNFSDNHIYNKVVCVVVNLGVKREPMECKECDATNPTGALVPIHEPMRGGDAVQQHRRLLHDGRVELLDPETTLQWPSQRAFYGASIQNCANSGELAVDLNYRLEREAVGQRSANLVNVPFQRGISCLATASTSATDGVV